MDKGSIWIKGMKIGAKVGCHQRPDRSFFICGYQLPVCARCTGILIGYILSVLSCSFVEIPLLICVVMCLPMAIDGISQYLRIRESNNILRVLSGVVGGFGLMSIWIKIILFFLRKAGVI